VPGTKAGVQIEQSTYDPAVYASLVAVEDRHFWFRARNRAIVAAFESVRPRLPYGYRVLEVGCGTGNVLRALQVAATGGVVVGMDLHIEGLRVARDRVRPALVLQADAESPPFSVKFDVVGAFDVIEHLDDDVAVLKTLRKLLTDRGFLLLTVPASPSLWSYFDVGSHHRRRYVLAELRDKLASAGYTVEFVSPYMSALFPILWVARRVTGRRYNRHAETGNAWEVAESDLRVRPISGAILGFVLKAETALLRRRTRLPFGASLMAIARAV
jgi:SAM-dependent methyltransferase